ncbi:peptide chain release factor N(5)-glutamine methyltransferase [Chloroflexota bacterium]
MTINDWSLKTGEPRVGEVISKLKSQLSNRSESPSLDSQVLVAHICGQNRAWVLAHPEAILTPRQQETLGAMVSLLEAGKPLPYVLGRWEFYGLDFRINTEVLIPRPETELMVEQAIKWLQAHPKRRTAADIGTGSGCIAVSLAVHITDLHVTGTDIARTALEVASANAEKHNVTARVKFLHADMLPTNLPNCDLICANLPYIPTRTLEGLDVYGREPTLALDGGPDGLSLIRRLLPQAFRVLSSKGLLLLEIEATQGKTGVNLAREYFPEAQVDLLPDLAGRNRLIRIETFTV